MVRTYHALSVTIPSGERVNVEEKGDHTFSNGMKIKNVLHVPDFNCNLISVSKICNDIQCAVTFFPDFFVMHGLRSRTLIGSEGEVFYLKEILQVVNDDDDDDDDDDDISGTTRYTVEEPVVEVEVDPNVDFSPNTSIVNSDPVHEKSPTCEDEYLGQPCSNVQPQTNENNTNDHQIGSDGSSDFATYDKFENHEREEPVRQKINKTIDSEIEPKHFFQAVKDDRWIEAMKKEIQALEKIGTWSLEELPKGKRATDSKWVY
ncbi:uncharacterized protein LOC143592687 [Bidens hawaiensis]|uniref:uncharacterized protein LOC143592687 n=1 Tax=Bidens hawaiensis TaxID=980011 RepID=UPI004049C4DA